MSVASPGEILITWRNYHVDGESIGELVTLADLSPIGDPHKEPIAKGEAR